MKCVRLKALHCTPSYLTQPMRRHIHTIDPDKSLATALGLGLPETRPICDPAAGLHCILIPRYKMAFVKGVGSDGVQRRI